MGQFLFIHVTKNLKQLKFVKNTLKGIFISLRKHKEQLEVWSSIWLIKIFTSEQLE